ncbi:hypothetical protein [Deinococcus aquiradiocola]|uniref:Uncharacterized protein n=1 Tax=Deinococcus aquiradiocola TaxID=393059 RepID=A0A917PLG7_9DEIO|nr:hypothetical protein [Deinococcus aquiradiocola]GGJ83193.1 hypothetical protein GCM10008939_28820 [Deinococcus aquiradiocola]
MFFRRKPANPHIKDDGNGVYRLRVRTARHGDTVELRFTRAAHIGIDDDGSYVYRKAILSSQHLDRGEVTVRFDKRYAVTSADVEGGELIPFSDWEE